MFSFKVTYGVVSSAYLMLHYISCISLLSSPLRTFNPVPFYFVLQLSWFLSHLLPPSSILHLSDSYVSLVDFSKCFIFLLFSCFLPQFKLVSSHLHFLFCILFYSSVSGHVHPLETLALSSLRSYSVSHLSLLDSLLKISWSWFHLNCIS